MDDGNRESGVGSAARGRGAAVEVLRVVLAAALLAGCGDDPSPVFPLEPCTSAVSVTATSEAVPEFSWTPPCGVARLTVSSPPVTGAPVTLWSITSLTSRIPPGVRYGSVPSGALQTDAPRALVAGRTINVTVYDQSGVILGLAPVTVP